MIGKETIKSVLARTGVSEADFFGPRRAPQLTAARAMAIRELTELGLSASAIGRIVRRNHVSVLYWRKPDMREARQAAHLARYVPRPKREPKPKRARVYKSKKKPEGAVRHRCYYTAQEDATARSLLLRGASTEECKRILGRTRASVRKRIRLLDDHEYRERCHQYDRNRPTKKRESIAAVALRPPKGHEAQFVHAQARASAPRTLTASLLGDPPRGFSALDQRTAEARV